MRLIMCVRNWEVMTSKMEKYSRMSKLAGEREE